MGKGKKVQQNRPAEGSRRGELDANSKNKIDILTSQLVDICSHRPGNQETINSLWQAYLTIRDKVNEIRANQTSVSASIFQPAVASRGERLKDMVDWCNRNGLTTNGVSIAAFDDSGENFGLLTEKVLEVGDNVVCVPRRLFLSVENVLPRNEILQKLFENDPLLKGMSNVALTLLVAVEKLKGVDSFWYAYLNSLPSSYVTPVYLLVDGSEKVAELLRGSVAFEETLKLYKNIVRQYAYFYQMISSSSANFAPLVSSNLLSADKFVFDLYLWAAVTVMTRINFVPSAAGNGKNDMVPALIPFFDMANHGDVPLCTDVINDEDDFTRQRAVIYASKIYQPQNQLLIYYGDRKYWEYFLHNGFVYEDGRKYPNVTIKLGLSTSDSLLELKTAALQRYGLRPSENFCISKYDVDESDSSVLKEMKRFAIVFCSREEELGAFCSGAHEAAQFEWTPETVERAREFLHTRLSLLLRIYVPVVTAESSVVKSLDSDKWQTLIKNFIRGEVESLKSCIKVFERQCQ